MTAYQRLERRVRSPWRSWVHACERGVYRFVADRSARASIMTPVERVRVVYWRGLAYGIKPPRKVTP